MKKIEGSPKNLRQLLSNMKYSIHYYQREYMWQRKHIEELIDDLTSEFFENYKENDQRPEVDNYGTYFMGSIILSDKDKAIIDGQQRLSSLTLLLIYLNNQLKRIGEHHSVIENMIFSESFGKKSFNIDVQDRYDCMEAIFYEKEFDVTNRSESVHNLYERYSDIADIFPLSYISDNILLHFCDWLSEKVFFIEIIAQTEQDAHKIFITMNDRGLSLTSTDMLKGYILSEIKDDKIHEDMNAKWKNCIFLLKKDDDKGDESFIKAWLRAHYAESIRDTKAGSVNKDFDIIGGPFHKWVRDERDKLGLKNSNDFEMFVEKFVKFSEIYMYIRKAESIYSDDTKYIYYNAQVNFTIQPQLLLAPICYNDTWPVIREKLNLVARFIDILIVSRVMENRSLNYSSIKNYIFNITKDIRLCDIFTLKQKLMQYYNNLNFNAKELLDTFSLNNFTKKYIKHILARVISYIEENICVAPNYVNYMNMKTKNPFEIEHIISDHYEWFSDEYSNPDDFKIW